MKVLLGASQIDNPHPKSLSQDGRGTLKYLAPLLPAWEKGLGDEGKPVPVGCTPFCSKITEPVRAISPW